MQRLPTPSSSSLHTLLPCPHCCSFCLPIPPLPFFSRLCSRLNPFLPPSPGHFFYFLFFFQTCSTNARWRFSPHHHPPPTPPQKMPVNRGHALRMFPAFVVFAARPLRLGRADSERGRQRRGGGPSQNVGHAFLSEELPEHKHGCTIRPGFPFLRSGGQTL